MLGVEETDAVDNVVGAATKKFSLAETVYQVPEGR